MGGNQNERFGQRLRELRNDAGMTLRAVCKSAGVALSYLSNLERGVSSPTLATLHRILHALGTDLEAFFSSPFEVAQEGCAFRRQEMRTAADATRRYTFMLPRRKDIKAEMLDEFMMAGESSPDFEVLECDIAGAIHSGTLELEVEGEEKHVLCAGDAFYVPRGKKHRGRCISSEPVHLTTIFVPPKY